MVIPASIRNHLIGIAVVAAGFVWLSNAGTVRHDVKVQHVGVSAARELIDAGALVVDVRPRDRYQGRHIPGAIAVPLADLEAALPEAIRAIPKDRSIVVYCNDGLVTGPRGTEILNKAGFARAVNLKEGIEGWSAAGYPVGKS